MGSESAGPTLGVIFVVIQLAKVFFFGLVIVLGIMSLLAPGTRAKVVGVALILTGAALIVGVLM